MGLPIQEELKQNKPFPSLRQEVLVNISRTAAVLGYQFEITLKPYGITPTQFNVLRILRGAGKTGLFQHQIRERLVARVPDVPRLMKRMEQTGLISQSRDEVDRRAVLASISKTGLDLLLKIDRRIERMDKELLTSLNESQLKKLNELLNLAR